MYNINNIIIILMVILMKCNINVCNNKLLILLM